MKLKLVIVVMWLVVAFVVNDHTNFLDWSLGLVTGVFFADFALEYKARRQP